MSLENQDQQPVMKRSRGRAWAIALLVAGIVALLVAGTVWLIRLTAEPVASQAELRRAAYDSAMRKAGVDATMPPEPVDLRLIETFGSHSFEATFTAEEIAALLNTYPFTSTMQGATVSLEAVRLAFDDPGVVSMRGRLSAGDRSFSARLTAPASWSATGLSSTGVTELRVSGIEPDAEQTAQASAAVVAYFNELIRAAPGLVVREAAIVEGGLAVSGDAPDTITHPPAP